MTAKPRSANSATTTHPLRYRSRLLVGSRRCSVPSERCSVRSEGCSVRSEGCSVRSEGCSVRSERCSARSGRCSARSGRCSAHSERSAPRHQAIAPRPWAISPRPRAISPRPRASCRPGIACSSRQEAFSSSWFAALAGGSAFPPRQDAVSFRESPPARHRWAYPPVPMRVPMRALVLLPALLATACDPPPSSTAPRPPDPSHAPQPASSAPAPPVEDRQAGRRSLDLARGDPLTSTRTGR